MLAAQLCPGDPGAAVVGFRQGEIWIIGWIMIPNIRPTFFQQGDFVPETSSFFRRFVLSTGYRFMMNKYYLWVTQIRITMFA